VQSGVRRVFFLGITRAVLVFISRVDWYQRAFFSDAPSILQHAVNICDQLIMTVFFDPTQGYI
jgi:hypothetical protein